MNYQSYHFSHKERFWIILESAGLTGVVAYLCYHSIFVMAGMVVIYPLLLRRKRKEKIRQQKATLSVEFKDTLQAVAGALAAGYSLENAFREAEKEVRQLYGKQSCMVRELQEMNAKTALNQPIEQQLLDFSKRSGIEDVESFCQVLLFAKRGGGDFVKIIKTTVGKIADKIEIQREIETVMAAKRLEQNVMQAVPVFILLYLDLTSPEFLSVLYGNLIGICFMTVCLVFYLLSVRMAEKIVDIAV